MFRVSAIACVATVLGLIPSRGSPAADYSGNYLLDDGGYRIELSLQADADGTVRGGMNDDGVSLVPQGVAQCL